MAQSSASVPIPALALEDIRSARELLGDRVITTPVHEWHSQTISDALGDHARVFMKLELLQRTGSFKARGALLNLLRLTPEQRERGVTAISAGNHAVAVSYAAQALRVNAKVVMIKTANPFRVALCRSFGADIEFAEDAHIGFKRVAEIEKSEGRALIHPFEGFGTATGTATLGFELCQQVERLDAVIIPIGGGGLCAGVASAV